MRSVLRLVLVVVAMMVLGGAVLAPAATAASNPAPSPTVTQVAAAAPSHPSGPTAGNAPAGPNINQQQHNADAAKSKHKLVAGIVVVGLLVIVYYGHRQRAKHRIRKRNLQNAKS